MSPKKSGARKRPGAHTVHTKHSRYDVPRYPRGSGHLLETREGVTKSRKAWAIDDALRAEPLHDSATDAWKSDHNRSDAKGVDDPEFHLSMDKEGLIIRDIRKEKRAFRVAEMKRDSLKAKLKAQKRRPTNSEVERFKGYEDAMDQHKAESERLAKTLGKPVRKIRAPSPTKKELLAPIRTDFGDGQTYKKSGKSFTQKGVTKEANYLERLGIRSVTVPGDKGRYFIYTHENDFEIRGKDITISEPSKALMERFVKVTKTGSEEYLGEFNGLSMDDTQVMGVITTPRKIWDYNTATAKKGGNPGLGNVETPITHRIGKIKVTDISKRRTIKREHDADSLRVGNTLIDARYLRQAVSVLGKKNLYVRSEQPDYPVLIQNGKGESIMIAPMIGMGSNKKGEDEFAEYPRLKDIEGVSSVYE